MASPPDPARIAYEATAPARWLLDAAQDGVALTQTHALARAVVREAAERWPGWWNAELFGPPQREADVRVLEAVHDGLKRLRLVRRRGRVLHATARGRQLAADPRALLQALAEDLGGGDPFSEMVAVEVIDQLRAHEHREHDRLAAGVVARARRVAGAIPTVNRRRSETYHGWSATSCVAARRTDSSSATWSWRTRDCDVCASRWPRQAGSRSAQIRKDRQECPP